MSATDPAIGVVRLPWGAWSSDGNRAFAIPASWRVSTLAMRDRPALGEDEIGDAIDGPIGAPPIDQLVTATSRVAIAVDDITRPAPVAPVLAAVVERLTAAGVHADRITVLVATGAHRRATAADVAQKIGPALAARLRVLSHDPLEPLVDTGVALAGVTVHVNRTFYEADVRIGICGVMPHPFAAYSGGGKIVIPGLANLDVLVRTHKYALMGFAGGHAVDGNRFRADMEKAVRAIGLHWTANLVVNGQRRIAFVAAGDFVAAHRAAVDAAAAIGSTSMPAEPLDAVLVNAYPKDGELLQVEAALVILKNGILQRLQPQAPIVLMAACAEGLGTHGLFGPGGRLFRVPGAKGMLAGRPLLIYSPGVQEGDVRSVFWSGYPFFTEWNDVLTALETSLPSNPHVGVVPCGPLQVAERSVEER